MFDIWFDFISHDTVIYHFHVRRDCMAYYIGPGNAYSSTKWHGRNFTVSVTRNTVQSFIPSTFEMEYGMRWKIVIYATSIEKGMFLELDVVRWITSFWFQFNLKKTFLFQCITLHLFANWSLKIATLTYATFNFFHKLNIAQAFNGSMKKWAFTN